LNPRQLLWVYNGNARTWSVTIRWGARDYADELGG